MKNVKVWILIAFIATATAYHIIQRREIAYHDSQLYERVEQKNEAWEEERAELVKAENENVALRKKHAAFWKEAKREKEIQNKIPKESEEASLKKRLNYLYNIPEISWIKFEHNSVYIGFNSSRSDVTTILRMAAFHGNKAIDFGVHIYAYKCSYPTTGGNFFKGATCRYGKVKHY